MKFLKAAPTVLGLALLGLAFSPSAKADDWNKKTVITFSGPVEIPGVHLQGYGVLPAGTYVFKILDSKSDRHIVQIFSQDELTVYATILAIPNYRLVAKNKTVITFSEGLKDSPQPIRAWFYPGANWGEEFVYPKAKAVELAKVTKVPVLALEADVPVEVAKPEEPQIVAVLQQAPVMAVRPTGEVVEIAQVIQTEPQREVAAPTTLVAENKLPATGSSLPLIALCGLLALGSAFGIRAIRKVTL